MSAETEAIDAAVFEAVQLVAEGDMVTRYLLVAETIDAETGSRALVTLADDGASPWDVVGLADYAKQRARAHLADID